MYSISFVPCGESFCVRLRKASLLHLAVLTRDLEAVANFRARQTRSSPEPLCDLGWDEGFDTEDFDG